MSPIVWTTLITAVATVTASLGAVWIKGHYDDRAQARQVAENRVSARRDQQRQAYGELVKTALLTLRNFRQLIRPLGAYEPDIPADIPAFHKAFSQTTSLAADMNQAAAVAELVGSRRGRQHARVIYNKAKACADMFQLHELFLSVGPPNTVGRKLFGGMYRKKMAETFPLNVEEAEALCGELEVAIDAFIEVVNTELGQ